MVPNNNNNKKKKNNALPLPDLSAAPQIKKEWGEGLLPPFLIPPPPPCIALARPISGGAFLFFSGKSCFVRVRSRHIPQKKKKRQPGERKRETFFLPLPPVSSSVSRQFGPNSLNFFFPLPLSIPPHPTFETRREERMLLASSFLFSMFLSLSPTRFATFFFAPLEKDLSGWNIRRSKVSSLPYFKRTRLQICSRNNAARHNPPGMFGIAKKD